MFQNDIISLYIQNIHSEIKINILNIYHHISKCNIVCEHLTDVNTLLLLDRIGSL